MLVLYLSLIDEEDNKQKFEIIYRSYRKQMATVAISIVQNQADAEDVVHDVFVNIATKYMETVKQISDETDLRNYLLKATKNTALNWKKKEQRWVFFIDDEDREFRKKHRFEISDDKFIEYLCETMEYNRVLEAIKILEPKYRDVLYYHFVMEVPVPELAKNLNQSLATTKKQLVRGKKRLLQLLEEE